MSRKAANGASYEVFETTMARLEQALSVGQIATFGFTSCDAGDDPQQVLREFPDFDQIPVENDGLIVGVLERGEETLQPTVAEAMRPLGASMLVAAEQPLTGFIPAFAAGSPYRLVLRGQELDGIVTRSDMLKLPVRLLAFARVTHLELLLANLIAERYPETESWLALLSKEQRKTIENHHKRLSKGRIEPAWLELSGFEHKCTVISNLSGLADSFAADMVQIKDLRDQLAHAKDFVADEKALDEFLHRLQLADHWIAELSTILDRSKPGNQ